MNLHFLLILAGLAQFGILIASFLTPQVLDWRGQLAALPELMRHLFWVYGGYIVMMIIALGSATLLHASEIAAGAPVARSIAVFATIFWGVRLGIQLWVFDAEPYLTSRWLRLGYHALTAVFAGLTAVYAWAAAAPALRFCL